MNVITYFAVCFSYSFILALNLVNQSPQVILQAVGQQGRDWRAGILLPQDFCGKTVQAVLCSQSKYLIFSNSPESLLATNRWLKSLRTLGTRLSSSLSFFDQ